MPGHIDLNSLPTLKAQLAQGEEVLLTRDGRVVAKVVPVAPDLTEAGLEQMAERRRALFGRYSGQIDVEAFESPLPEDILESMTDPGIFPPGH